MLRAVGDNSVLVTSLSKDKGTIKIIGLVISNALVALSGAVACQEQRSFSATMGTGQIVFGLAAVIIGTTLFRRVSFIKGTTAVIFGSVIYKACIQIAISLGLPANLLKLITAVLFLAILVLGNLQKGSVKKNCWSLSIFQKLYNPGLVTEMCLFDDFNFTVNDGEFVSVIGSNRQRKNLHAEYNMRKYTRKRRRSSYKRQVRE